LAGEIANEQTGVGSVGDSCPSQLAVPMQTPATTTRPSANLTRMTRTSVHLTAIAGPAELSFGSARGVKSDCILDLPRKISRTKGKLTFAGDCAWRGASLDDDRFEVWEAATECVQPLDAEHQQRRRQRVAFE
jgi:hypothetical protein